MPKGLSMTELLIVVIIVGVLATITVVYGLQSKEQTADKEAINNLILLSSAQQDYRVDMGTYVASSDQALIRRELKVMISNNADRLWNYSVKSDGCVQANRTDGSRKWSLTIADVDRKPNVGACP